MSFTRWIETIRYNDNVNHNLFCFHHAGGAASFFNSWKDRINNNMNIFAIQLPGRESRFTDEAHPNIIMTAQKLAEHLTFSPESKNYFFGHSMGALIAYETIKYLFQHQQQIPLHLIVSACRAPHLPERLPLHHLPDSEFIENIINYNGTPKEIFIDNPELLDLLLPMMRSDFNLSETYLQPLTQKFILPIPITAFYPLNDDSLTSQDMLGWESYTCHPFQLHTVPGDHFYLKDPNASLYFFLDPGNNMPLALSP